METLELNKVKVVKVWQIQQQQSSFDSWTHLYMVNECDSLKSWKNLALGDKQALNVMSVGCHFVNVWCHIYTIKGEYIWILTVLLTPLIFSVALTRILFPMLERTLCQTDLSYNQFINKHCHKFKKSRNIKNSSVCGTSSDWFSVQIFYYCVAVLAALNLVSYIHVLLLLCKNCVQSV